MLISGKIKNMFQGVSEQAASMRLPTQGERMDNFYPSLVDGLIKRPPTKHITTLDPRFSNCKMYHIKRDANQEYILLLGRNNIAVLDMNGRMKEVAIDARGTYMDTDNLTATTIADHTFIINQDKEVLASEDKTPLKKSVLIFIKQASYQTDYHVKILNQKGAMLASASHSTPENVGTVEKPPKKISTQEIAKALADGISKALVAAEYTIVQGHSTIHIYSANFDTQLTCEAWDSRGNTHITAIHNRVQRFADLPSHAPSGYNVEVVGDGSNSDNYYLTFVKDNGENAGVLAHSYNSAICKIATVKSGTKYTANLSIDGFDIVTEHTTQKSITPAMRRRYIIEPTAAADTTYTVTAVVEAATAKGTCRVGANVVFTNTILIPELPTASKIEIDYGAGLGFETVDTQGLNRIFVRNKVGEAIRGTLQAKLGVEVKCTQMRPTPQGTYNPCSVYVLPPQGAIIPAAIKLTCSGSLSTYTTAITSKDAAVLEKPQKTNAEIAAELATSLAVALRSAGITDVTSVSTSGVLCVEDSVGGRTLLMTCSPTASLKSSYVEYPATISGVAVPTAEDIVSELARGLDEQVRGSILTHTLLKVVGSGKELHVHAMKPSITFTLSLKDSTGARYPVTYTGESSGATMSPADGSINKGVWRESLKQGTRLGLDNATMPHVLVNMKDKFYLKEAAWCERTVGDENLAPDPVFVGRPIRNMMLFRNRLSFLSDDTVSLSAAGDFMRLYPETVMTLMSSDPIFLASGHSEVTRLLYSLPYQESLLIFAEQAQFVLTGGDVLSAETAELQVATNYNMRPDVAPVNSGHTVFYASGARRQTDIHEYYTDANLGIKDAAKVTAHVPDYIKGEVKTLACSAKEDLLAVLPKRSHRNKLYMYKYYWSGEEKLQAAWFTFELPKGDIKDVIFADSRMYLLVMYERELSLECIDFAVAPYKDNAPNIIYADRQITLSGGTYKDGTTQWSNIPYSLSIYTDDELLLIDTDTYQSVPFTRNGNMVAVKGDMREKSIVLGIRYASRYVFSQQYARDARSNEVMTHFGRLLFRNWCFVYGKSNSFTITVTHRGGQAYRYKFDSKKTKAGNFPIPVRGNSQDVVIAVENGTHLPCSIVSVEWEATTTTRSRLI